MIILKKIKKIIKKQIYINVFISKNKYKLLDKIDSNKIAFVIDEIYELRYLQYMKNFIKS